MRLIYGFLYLFLLLKCIESLNLTDLGLPNNNHCAYSINQTLYILGQNNVSITFGSPWNTDPPKISIQPNNTSRRIACTITRSGKVVLFPSSQPNITYGGSQAAIDRFITNTIPLENYATVGFNDYVLIQGGRDTTTEYSTTYILDTRFPTQWTWYELTNTSFTPPPASSNASLAATSRWILYFRTEHVGGPNYLTTVDCFDPYSFLWLGTVTTFNTTTNLIQAVPIVSSAPGTDSLLLVPAWSDQTESNVTTNGFMRLDISTWVYNDVRMTTASTSTKRDVVEYKPVAGGTVTRVNNTELVVFYGGGGDLSFFNATSLDFLPQPQWLDNTTMQHNDRSDSSRNRNLPIILGSVMGGLLFIAVVALFIWCMMRRKRSLHQNRQQQEDMWICWPFIPKKNAYDTANTKDESLPYVLSPIQATSPIQMFPSLENDEKPVLTSRFIEHFDYHSFPLSKNNNRASASMQNIATSSFGSSQIPRSASSYV